MLACCAAAAFLVGQVVWLFRRARARVAREADPRLVVEIDAAAVWRPGSAPPAGVSTQAVRPAWRKPKTVAVIVANLLLVALAASILAIEPTSATDDAHGFAAIDDWWRRAIGQD